MSRLPKQPNQILASMPYVDDYDTIVHRSVDNDVASSRDDEAAVLGTKLGSGWSHIGMVRKA